MDRPGDLEFGRSKYAWRPDVGYREHPELDCAGKGEQGVPVCAPHKVGPDLLRRLE